MAANSKPCQTRPPRSASEADHPEAFYQLHSLLDTIRTLASHEDEICTLLTTLQRSRSLTPAARRDLARLLDALPTQCLELEVSALQRALESRAA